jgi:hypothetical protein
VATCGSVPRKAAASTPILLIVDRGPAHRAKKTAAFVETQRGIAVVFPASLCAARNPDALAGKYLEADTIGRMAVAGMDDFQRKVLSSLRHLQIDLKKIRSFYSKVFMISRLLMTRATSFPRKLEAL